MIILPEVRKVQMINGKSIYIGIPQDIAKYLGIKKGDLVKMDIHNDTLLVQKVEL